MVEDGARVFSGGTNPREARRGPVECQPCHYAAYQSVTAVLLYYGLTPPDGREAWSHEATPELIWKLAGTIMSQNARKDIAQRLEAAFRLRLVADYISVAEVGEAVLKTALKNASFIARLAEDVLSQG